jgi:SEFIR domain
MGLPGESEDKLNQLFISWAHLDTRTPTLVDITWTDSIRALAERLRNASFEVKVDLFEQDPDWSRWGPSMIDKSDFTIIVPNRAYKERWDGENKPTEGAGAAREINTLKGKFDKDQNRFRRRTIIVKLPGVEPDEVPDEIYSFLTRFEVDPIEGSGMNELLRFLTKQPRYVLPERGMAPVLPPEPFVTTTDLVIEPNDRKVAPLPIAEPFHAEFSRLTELIETTGPAPACFGDDLGGWMNSLGEWIDCVTTILDIVARVSQLIHAEQSISFVQACDDAREKKEHIIAAIELQPTDDHAETLASTAQELWDLLNELAEQLLEPGGTIALCYQLVTISALSHQGLSVGCRMRRQIRSKHSLMT